ncbi:MAG: PKD domain-containing protein [Thermodesulfobacteriota bacterium]
MNKRDWAERDGWTMKGNHGHLLVFFFYVQSKFVSCNLIEKWGNQMGKRKIIDQAALCAAMLLNKARGFFITLCAFLWVFLMCSAAAAAPQVNVMPDGYKASDTDYGYTWVGNALSIWGNVKWDGSATGTYTWDINNDGVADYSGTVTNAKDIAIAHTYAAAGVYDAKLTVTDGIGASDSAMVRIRVLPVMTKNARIELAIERGLKWLYLRQIALGGAAIYYVNSYSSAGAETGAAVLAFENRGHKPCTQDLNSDGVVNAVDRALWEKDHIYAETVHKGLDYMISTLVPVGIGAEPAGNPDTNGNAIGIRDANRDRSVYKIGMYMMALVGAGDVASGAPDLVTTTGPTNVIGRTYRDIVQDMIDWCAYGQNDPATGSYRGGWRYTDEYGSSDNSACQWPAIGMEAAEVVWGCTVPAFVKIENAYWTTYSQDVNGRFGYTSATAQGTGGYAACTGSGICELCFQGKVKNDSRIVLAGNYLRLNPSQRGTGNIYYMYAVTKGARIAKIDTNSDGIGDTYSEIETLGSAPGWDWYDEYSTWLIDNQNAAGWWYTWSYTQYVLDTAWAVEILTRNVFELRPVANIVAIPNPTPANSPIGFDISASSHQDTAKFLVSWRIDVDNDGTFDLSGNFPVADPVAFVGYADRGFDYSVTARLEVTDNVGDIGEDTVSIEVTSGNVPPVAVPGGPYNGAVGQPITFDGSASYDPNEGQGIPGDHIVSWEWDLDGDGQYDDASGQVVQKTWDAPYQGQIGLKVTDDAGLSSTASADVYTEVFVVDLWPENYVLVRRTRINIYVYEYEYRFDMRNRGNADADNVECTIDSVPPQITVMVDHVTFGTVPAGEVITSGDTFILREDRRYPVSDLQIRWELEYDDQDGNHVRYIDFPLR